VADTVNVFRDGTVASSIG